MLYRLRGALLAALLLPAALAVSAAQEARPGPARPRLVVLLVVDQLRTDYLARWAEHFTDGGFTALAREGAFLANAHFSHFTTYTAPGHAQVPSGSFARTSGIVGNRWYNRAAGRVESIFYDPDAALLPAAEGRAAVKASPAEDDTSPRNFLGTTVGDQLLLATGGRARVMGLANKDRAAIALAGRLGKAYWFHDEAGATISSSYYGSALPGWLQEFNRREVPASCLGKVWERALPEQAYADCTPDDAPGEYNSARLGGRTFPHRLTDPTGKPTAAYYAAFAATPFANDYQLQLARLAIEHEQLGADAIPDLLGISLSAPDLCGHAFGPHSHEQKDMLVRTDAQLASFFRYLRARFQPGELILALTSDHGVCPIPEQLAARGIDAGRVRREELREAVEHALNTRYGQAQWVQATVDPGLLLHPEPIRARGLDPAEVQRLAGEACLAVKGVAGYVTRAQLDTGTGPRTRWRPMLEKSYFPSRSGDVFVVTRPHYFLASADDDAGTTHGSPYEYDTHVPLFLVGPGVRAGTWKFAADVADLAPTLAMMLGLTPPAGCEGRVLHEILETAERPSRR